MLNLKRGSAGFRKKPALEKNAEVLCTLSFTFHQYSEVWVRLCPRRHTWVEFGSLLHSGGVAPQGTPVFPSHQKPNFEFDLICCGSFLSVVSTISKTTCLLHSIEV